ncbi:MAG: transposase [Coriobacteriia bacterium]|nr:transposase [Coriobacteriia bacterium]
MLTRILHENEQLCTLVRSLKLDLSAPQLRHVIRVADALLVTDAPKTLAELRRQFVDCVDPSNIADTLRIAPWTAQAIRQPLMSLMMQVTLERLKQEGQDLLLINLDDSLAVKDPGTRCLEAVDWHYDHSHKSRKRDRIQNGMEYLVCNIVAGDRAFTFAVQPYLGERTVRRLNRERSPKQRLHFVSKPRLARQILEACRVLIPAEVAVRVQFDSWYASADLLRYIRRQGWHAVCRLKPNRRLSGQRVDQRGLAQRHRRYVPVDISVADGSKRTYLVRSMTGRLHKVPFDVCVLVSRRHYRDRYPVYFASTDLTLSPQQALQGYAKRWNCETDNWYLKERLGLGDFRVQSYEAIDKFCAVVLLSLAYLQWRLIATTDSKARNCADAIRQHRDEHAEDWLRGACQEVLASGDIEAVLKRFLPPAA